MKIVVMIQMATIGWIVFMFCPLLSPQSSLGGDETQDHEKPPNAGGGGYGQQ